MSHPLVVGIAGGTASGKTTVARKICDRLKDCRLSLIDQDSYYRDLSDMSFEERLLVNFDHPDAFDTELLVEHIRALKAGRAVQKPKYSFVNCVREAETVPVEPSDAIIIEGILVLGIEAIRKELDVRIFVDADGDVRIVRRLTRDIKERGRDFDAIVSQYFKSVRPMHYGFVEPSKRWADIIIPHGGNNDVSIDMVVGAIRQRLPK
ncbi:MAG: uridine kinase [Myxococcales bacterium]|jgi:uridine kinase